jgi:hypothetical protein
MLAGGQRLLSLFQFAGGALIQGGLRLSGVPGNGAPRRTFSLYAHAAGAAYAAGTAALQATANGKEAGPLTKAPVGHDTQERHWRTAGEIREGDGMQMDIKTLRALEGLGYVAAVMIGVGGLRNNEVTKIFNVLGLVFAVIVIVRLMVIQIIYGHAGDEYRAEEPFESDLHTLDEGEPPETEADEPPEVR